MRQAAEEGCPVPGLAHLYPARPRQDEVLRVRERAAAGLGVLPLRGLPRPKLFRLCGGRLRRLLREGPASTPAAPANAPANQVVETAYPPDAPKIAPERSQPASSKVANAPSPVVAPKGVANSMPVLDPAQYRRKDADK